MSDIQVYKQKNDYMSSIYHEVTAEELYSAIFPLDGMEKKGDKLHRASNPIFTYREKAEKGKDGKERSYFRNEILFSDSFTESIAKSQKNSCSLMSMCSYSGRTKTAKNAFKCHGFIIDLDGVGMKQLETFWGWVEHLEKIPNPTYVANSGHGLHIYYVFENPVPLYPRVREHLQQLKRGLTEWVWNKWTSSYDVKDRQYQGIYQSFRMVGSCTKLGKGKSKSKYLVKAWKTGKPVSISYLNKFVEDKYKCPEDPDYASWDWAAEEHKTLSECQELYPEWYERRIVRGEPAGQWKCSKGLYNWWLRKIQETGAARDGNRYHCVSMLYVYGQKCMIDKSLIDADAEDLLEPFNELTKHEDNAFTKEDVRAASQFYDTKYAKMTRKEISRRTGIPIEPRRRNGRSREVHVKLMNAMRDVLHPDGNWRNKDGAPTKQEIVQAWREAHPTGKKADCIRDTGLSKPTVLKWWD